MTPQVGAKLNLQGDDAEIAFSRPRLELPGAASAEGWLSADALASVALRRPTSAALVGREGMHRRLLCVADIASVGLTVVIMLGAFGQRRVAPAVLVGVALLLLLFKVAGLYDRDDLRLAHSTLDEVPLLAQLTGLVALGVAVLQSSAFAGTLGANDVAALWVALFATVLVGRSMARIVAGRTSPLERCLVIGERRRASRVQEKLASSGARAKVIASVAVDDDLDGHGWRDIGAVMRSIVREENVHRIIIATATTDTQEVAELIRTAKAIGVRVSVLPRVFEVVGSAFEFDDIEGMTMLAVRCFGLSRSSRVVKRTFDIVIAALGTVIISPVIAAIAIAIRIDSGGPIFFRQIRVGRDGETFRIFKFRSMVGDAELQKDKLRSLNEAGDGLFKLTDDPRVTRVGRFLRHTSLDELPQLINVLRGEMSLVGPRPLVTDEDARVVGLDRSRLHLTPGITGPWQVLAARVPMPEMVGIDYLYVANWSLWADLKILLRTVRRVARRGNI